MGSGSITRRPGPGDGFDPARHDLIYIGGGQDRDQVLVAEDMLRYASATRSPSAVEDGAALLAVCGGYQLLGHSYQLGDNPIPGLGRRRPGDGPRGRAAADRQRRDRGDLGEGPAGRVLAGFENHGGRTRLGAGAQPLGRVLHGHGNNGTDGHEGVRRLNMFGTYLHGPLLPKNAAFADRLIALAIERRTGSRPVLEPLEDSLEDAAHAGPSPRPSADDGLRPERV